MEDNKTMTVLEIEGCDYRLYKNWYKAQHQMLMDWFDGGSEADLTKALELLDKIGQGTNDPYDLGDVKRIVKYVKDDLHDALHNGYIEGYAWTYTAEVMD